MEISQSEEVDEERAHTEAHSTPVHESHTAYVQHSWLVWIMPRFIGGISFIILLTWIYLAEGGIGKKFQNMFGVHAVLMALCVIVFVQESVLFVAAPLFAPCRERSKMWRSIARFSESKSFHVLLHVLGVTCCAAGIYAMVYYKQLAPEPVSFPFYTMYSVHSWVGVCFVGMWFIQFAFGIYIHGCNNRKWKRYHAFFGRAVYIIGLTTCALGFQDMQSSDLAGSVPPWVDASNFTQEQIDGMGYYPTSALSQLSCAGALILIVQGMTTLYAHL